MLKENKNFNLYSINLRKNKERGPGGELVYGPPSRPRFARSLARLATGLSDTRYNSLKSTTYDIVCNFEKKKL